MLVDLYLQTPCVVKQTPSYLGKVIVLRKKSYEKPYTLTLRITLTKCIWCGNGILNANLTRLDNPTLTPTFVSVF